MTNMEMRPYRELCAAVMKRAIQDIEMNHKTSEEAMSFFSKGHYKNYAKFARIDNRRVLDEVTAAVYRRHGK